MAVALDHSLRAIKLTRQVRSLARMLLGLWPELSESPPRLGEGLQTPSSHEMRQNGPPERLKDRGCNAGQMASKAATAADDTIIFVILKSAQVGFVPAEIRAFKE